MKDSLVIGSRGSKLALVQAQMVKAELERLNPSLEVRIEIIKTTGDVKTEPLSIIGGKGVFTKELEDALLDGRTDIAVHSLKDLPTVLPDRLVIATMCKREDPRDALVLSQLSRFSQTSGARIPSIATLPKGATIGTSSPRRLAQLRHLRSDLVFKDLRGNVDTRLRKLDEGQYDALVLACAGLRRLDREDRISAPLSTQEMLPAVGQGAIAIEARAGDEDTLGFVSKLDHKFTRLACTAEAPERFLQTHRAVAVAGLEQQLLHRRTRRGGSNLAVTHVETRACVDHLPRHDRLVVADRSDDERQAE